MSTQPSDQGSLNKKEGLLGLLFAVIGAVIGLLWSGLTPVVEVFQSTGVLDFAPFLAGIDLQAIILAAIAAGGSYLGVTIPSGKKKDSTNK